MNIELAGRYKIPSSRKMARSCGSGWVDGYREKVMVRKSYFGKPSAFNEQGLWNMRSVLRLVSDCRSGKGDRSLKRDGRRRDI